MSATTTNAATNTNATTEAINDGYEFIQYNEHLRIIHSIKDDMYQMQSIITACKSNKQPTRWFTLSETKELLNELTTMQNCTLDKLYDKRDDLPNGIRGIYIHRLLVNDIACWASRKYAIFIAQLLDSYFERERQSLIEEIRQKKPRLVPSNKEHSYKYLIYKEPIDGEYTILHLVRRNK